MKKITTSIICFLSACILIFADQFTKYLAYTYLRGKGSVSIVGDILHLFYLRNRGAAWGVLTGRQPFFIILTFVLLGVMVLIFAVTPFTRKYLALRIVLVGIFAGAIGNLIDRIANGYVHDFIYFKFINFPIFNVADICVTVSMVILAILILFVYKDGDFAYLVPSRFSKKRNTSIESDDNNE